MYLQNIVCVAPVLHSQIVRTNILANIDTHTHKQTNTQGENIITSLTRVINIITSLTRVINMNTAVLHHLDSVFLIESQLNKAFNIDISTLCSMVPPYKRQRSVSTLDQVMDWCLTAPSHYLSQCWLFILCSVTFTIEQFHQKCSWRWRHIGHRGVSFTSLTIVYSTDYSDADQRKHQISASPAIVRGIHRDRWIPRTKGQ